LRAQSPGGRNCSFQQFRSNASAPIAFQHRHAADLRAAMMHDHPRRPNGSCRASSQEMNRAIVVAVELDLRRHTLLFDEHPHAYGEGFLQGGLRTNSADLHGCVHSRPYALDLATMQDKHDRFARPDIAVERRSQP
jgi:hypothetical protein